MEDGFYSRVEEELSGLLREEAESVLEKAVLRDHCDIFGFGNLLYQRDPDYWRANGEDWDSLLARCRYEVKVTAQVKRMEQERLGTDQY